jgi:2-polyprenyl-6-methoxyphenol hydroxylase-like FAD-dependent oxidoreductase
MAAAGAAEFDTLSLMPRFISDRERRPDDAKFVTLTARRPVIEYAFGTVASRSVDVRRDVHVTGLLTGAVTASRIPHVAGVRLASGEEVYADLVVDATGRRSRLPVWLEEIGARPVIEETEDYGFVYYTRFFRSLGSLPSPRGPLNTPIGSISILTLPGDSQTWSVTVFISSAGSALKTFRETDRWSRDVAACPNHEHWLDGEPISDVLPMAGATDRHRRFVIGDTPVATGVIAVGDALACTNPSLGRGITLGLMHAVDSVGVVRENLGDPLALARAHHEVTAARLTPWYRATVGIDRARAAAIHAEIAGVTLAPSEDPAAVVAREWALAMMYDADVYRSFAEMVGLLALPSEILARPGLPERIHQVAASHRLPPFAGPSRGELLEIAGAA